MSKLTEEYKKAITELADKHANRRFLNDSPEHAKLLADLMIGRAKEGDEVIIYSGKLKEPCFNEAFEATQGKVRILLDKEQDGVAVLQTLSPTARKRITCKVLKPDQVGGGRHFFVAGNSFRLEIDDDNATALANFNGKEDAEKLKQHFDKLWADAKEINFDPILATESV